MRFDGKVALVTGGAAGIGRATVLAFAREKARLIIVDREAGAGEDTAAMARAAGAQGARFIAADVTRSADVQHYVGAAVEAFGAIDCFVNNAGIEGRVAPIADYDEDVFDAVIAVNLKGAFLGLKHVLPVMLLQRRGAIVNMASTGGLFGSPGLCAYVASKHGVVGLTRTAASEYGAFGIRVNAVCPGPTQTRMIDSLHTQASPGGSPGAARARVEASIPIGRYCTPDEIANLTVFLCSDLASGISGAHFVADGGKSASPNAIRAPD